MRARPIVRVSLCYMTLLGLSSGAEAQAIPLADSLLGRLTKEALTSAPSILRADALARSAVSRVRPAGALPDPRLSVGAMDLTLPSFGFRRSDFTEVDVELAQEFPWPGNLGAQGRASKALAREASAQASALRRDVTLRIAEIYYRLRYIVTAQRALTRQRTLLQGAVDVSTAQYASATVSQGDPLAARVALARLGAEEAALTTQEAALRADLKAVRGAKTERIEINPIDPDSVIALLDGIDRAHRMYGIGSDSLDRHPRLQSRQAEVDAAEATATAVALSGRPGFEVSARYGARPLGSDFFSAFLAVRIPLWSGRKQRPLTEAARSDAEAARRGLDADRSDLNAVLERALAEAQGGATRLRLLVESVRPLAREGIDAALRGYRTGQVSFLAVLVAEDASYRTELEAAQVAAEHLTHLVMLEQLLAPESVP